MTITATRICPLCEATCGLTVELDGPRVLSVRPNRDDVFSEGHACAKGLGLGAVEEDPDRVRTPLVRHGGELREASWDEAFARIAEHLPPLVAHDPNSVAVYTGNPAAHQLDYTLYLPTLLGALGSRNLFSPASLDTLPKNLVCSLLYGTPLGMPVPDLDRTDLLILIGTNPLVSNGSTICAPGMDRRLAALRRRGGHLVVIDPARTRTAEVADSHLAVRPGRDAHLLLGMLSVIAAEGLDSLGNAAPHLDGAAEVLASALEFTPERVAPACGISAVAIRDLARRFATARRAVVHSRIGTCAQEFGTLANWLVEVLNAVTGRLDAVGGALFATPPGGGQTTWPGSMRGLPFDRWRSRVRGMPEAMGELPAACLAEEILTPGEGRVRALITLAGNPARSLPGSANVERALGELDFLLCLDPYLNETTRHADVLLPPPNLFSHGHIDLTLNHYQLRNVARWSAAAVEPAPGELPDWHQLLRLAAILRGGGTVESLDEEIATRAARRAATLVGVDTETALRAVGARRGPERLVDLRLRSGPYGDRFTGDGLSLAALEAAPDGIDYGPLGPRLPDVLRTPQRRIDLAPALLVEDLERVRRSLDPGVEGELLLINRRQRRGMNSWLHNALPHRDDAESALHMHPTDAARRGLVEGDAVVVESAAGRVTAALHLDDSVRQGVVSLPHGWGHTGAGVRLTHAAAAPGVNVNALVDDRHVEPITGIPIFNGIRVTVGVAR
ncbi:molybdopterin-dependent oxidoreductase [Pseudonocardia sp. WMMC193]|uniref:molybdopterin-dependent oxidoreductase n=1 Tax=Pseudonocardia sp. WMMC193 TaxID=2911965 RepID=UPI001F300EB9|nr:molybdopterin-dependent oxidoreductase [Pseudonocardia sp. WMMC193]MCF7549557.1 molybdopterin-dependent oxidoreductase [Pseudonocardia sp. WMMC193]